MHFLKNKYFVKKKNYAFMLVLYTGFIRNPLFKSHWLKRLAKGMSSLLFVSVNYKDITITVYCSFNFLNDLKIYYEKSAYTN